MGRIIWWAGSWATTGVYRRAALASVFGERAARGYIPTAAAAARGPPRRGYVRTSLRGSLSGGKGMAETLSRAVPERAGPPPPPPPPPRANNGPHCPGFAGR